MSALPNVIHLPSVQPNQFDEFWAAYPRKVAKLAAIRAWDKAVKMASAEEIIAAVEAQKKVCEQWQRDGGQFIPHPATWLNQGRWMDEIGSKVNDSVGGNF